MSVVHHTTSPDGSFSEYLMTATGRRYRVTITENPAVVDSWVRSNVLAYYDLRGHGIVHERPFVPVGLAIQWNNQGFASTLQVSMASRVLMVQLFRIPFIPPILRYFLSDPNIEFASFLNAGEIRNRLFFAPHALVLNSELHDLREVVPPHLFYAGLAELIYAEQSIGGFDLGHPHGPPWHSHHIWFTEEQLTVATLIPFAASQIAEDRL